LAKLRQETLSFVMFVRPSVYTYGTTWFPLEEFHENWYLNIFVKTVEKIQVALKSHKSNGYFTWRQPDICDHISLSSYYNEKCYRQTL